MINSTQLTNSTRLTKCKRIIKNVEHKVAIQKIKKILMMKSKLKEINLSRAVMGKHKQREVIFVALPMEKLKITKQRQIQNKLM
jgi:hypothetical protein